jgi:predicted membrane protein
LVGLAVTHPNLDGGIGQRTFHPTTVSDAQIDDHLGVGQLTVDLTDVPSGTEPLTVDASVGYGQIRVIVPSDAELRLRTNVNAGHTVVDGDEISDGIHRDDTRTIPALTSATNGVVRTIDLDLEVGAGEIKVIRAG